MLITDLMTKTESVIDAITHETDTRITITEIDIIQSKY